MILNTTLILILTLIIIAVGIIVYKQLVNKNKYQNQVYQHNLQKISEFIDLIQSLEDYVTWVQRDQIKAKYSNIGKYFKNKTHYYQKELNVKKFNDIYQDFDRYIVGYNQSYVFAQKEKLKDYFDDIEGKKLDDQQRTALITDEYSNLILAGAGSGKTLTILGKVKYLIEQRGINPQDILLLSFTRKTVEELNDRLNKMGLATKATTFHKLGYDILKQYHLDIPVLTNENTLEIVIREYFEKDIVNDLEALQAYIQYISCYMNIPEENDKFDSLGEKINLEKGIDTQTLKSKCEPLNIVANSNLDTIQGEKVKSVEELIIANYLYLNGIKYEYEKPYPFGYTVYRPDFYITEYDIYLEHFGVDEHNRAKWLSPFYEQKYVEEMKLKREAHITNNTKLLETYSYYNRDKILLQKLSQMLKAEGVVFKPLDAKSIYSKVTSNDNNFGKELFKLIQSFVNLSKSRRLYHESLINIFTDRSKALTSFILERQEMFLQFVLPILSKYNKVLEDKNEIDFNDMINRATDIVKRKPPDFSYRYIIIDEYQDISFARFNLIKEIRNLTGAKLICVGDDWQSIYRFAGSDISLFYNFEEFVGRSEKLLIEQTYRNSQELVDISSKYILKNPKQIQKNPKSKKDPLEDPIKLVHYKHGEVVNVFLNEIQTLVNKYGKKSILVLGRHSFDIHDLIKLTSGNKIKYIERTGKLLIKGFEDIDISYLTIHKSKGTEADNVIVLNLKNDLLGLPNKLTDDPILSLLLNDNEGYRFAEERRLFYVALTRSKNEVVLLIPPSISLFAEELINDNNYLVEGLDDAPKTTNCTYCKTGKLVLRENSSNRTQFLGCSNYPRCNQTYSNTNILDQNILCTNCSSGYMIMKKGKYGMFLGCTNYPGCRNTIKYN